MKLRPRTSRVVTGVLLCCLYQPLCGQDSASLVTPNTTTPKPVNTIPSAPAQDETNASPRERGRILVKRNPIASEYQVFGDLGTSPGADADGEGVDYRAFFPRSNPLSNTRDFQSVTLSLNYNDMSSQSELGGAYQFSKSLGAENNWALAGQFRTSASDRLIEHYESVWQEREYEGENIYTLDRPRFSFDRIYTKNKTYALQLGHQLTERHSVYFKTYYQDYFDNSYRNRLELNLGSGELDRSTEIAILEDTATRAAVTGGGTRRYFGDTDNERTRQHHTFGGSYEGEEWSIDYSLYAQRWNLDTLWYNWNFNDTGMDIAYDSSDPYLPVIEITEGADMVDSSGARFSSVRIHDTYTRDRDLAGRMDAERQLELGELDLWIQTGILLRTKERSTGEDRQVFQPNTSPPFYLDQVSYDSGPISILDGRYPQQAGLDPLKSRNFFESQSEYFTYSDYGSYAESAPQSYDAEETVNSAYLLGISEIGRWEWELGARLEYTETATRGTVIIPLAVNDASEGVFIDQITHPSNGSVSVVKDLYSENNYSNLLPTIGASFQVDETSKIKASWFQLLMRPQYFNIVDYRRVSIPTRSISEGNPELEPTTIDKFRLAWTKELSEKSSFSAEVYFIQIDSFFYGAVSEENILEDGQPVPYRVSRVENGDSGSIKGIELQWQQDLGAVLFFENASFEAAYTYSDSEATVDTRPDDILSVPERSDHLFKIGLKAKSGKFSANLSASYQSDALDDLGNSIDQDKTREKVIETSVVTNYAIDKSTTLSLTLANLNDHPERSYEGSPLRITRNQYSSWFGNLSLTKRF